MFDNPEKELQRLQRELLAAEDEDEEEYSEWEDCEDPDSALWEEEYPDAQEPRQPVPQQRRRKGGHIGGLLIAIVLEGLALAAAAAWWFLWR